MPESQPRKILLILEATLGGTGRHILDLSRGLLEGGDSVHLVFSRMRADQQFEIGLARLCNDWPNFRAYEIPIARPVVPSDLLVLWRLWRYVKSHGPFDVVHSHSTKAGFIARLLPISRTKQIYTPHSLMTMDPKLRGFKRRAVCALETMLARRCQAVVIVSEEEHRCALETGIPGEKIVSIENGVDLRAPEFQSESRLTFRSVLGIPADAICIGFVGRLCEHKEPYRVLEAFDILRRQTKTQVKLVVIGFGPLEKALRLRVKEMGMEADVPWLGPFETNVPMVAFDILAHTSRSEGLGYVFLEALASGVPIVTTRVGGVGEVVERAESGHVCDPWNAGSFAGHLLKLVEDSGHRAMLSANAKRASARFDISRMVNELRHLYWSISNPNGTIENSSPSVDGLTAPRRVSE